MTRATSKYRARKVTVDGIKFDSQGEANWYQGLLALQRGGGIKGLSPHPAYEIIINGEPLRYIDSGRKVIVEMDAAYREGTTNCAADFKGCDLPLSKLKRALLAHTRPDLKIVLAGPAAVRAARTARKPRAPRKAAAKGRGA